jgi:hypothetical protein
MRRSTASRRPHAPAEHTSHHLWQAEPPPQDPHPSDSARGSGRCRSTCSCCTSVLERATARSSRITTATSSTASHHQATTTLHAGDPLPRSTNMRVCREATAARGCAHTPTTTTASATTTPLPPTITATATGTLECHAADAVCNAPLGSGRERTRTRARRILRGNPTLGRGTAIEADLFQPSRHTRQPSSGHAHRRGTRT